MSSTDESFRRIDNTSPEITYTGQWIQNPNISGAYNNTLASSGQTASLAHIEFNATQVVVIGATVAPNGASANSGPVSAYWLDRTSGRTPFFYQSDVNVSSGVIFYNSGPISPGKHTLDISVVSIKQNVPYLLDAIYLKDDTTSSGASSTAAWVTTVFITPSSAPSSATGQAASSSRPPIGPIVGGVVGGVALIVVALLALFFFRRRRHGVYEYSKGFGGAPLFESEKDQPAGATPAVPGAAQVEPFLAAPSTTAYSDAPPYTPQSPSGHGSVAAGPPLSYPPGQSSGSGSGTGSSSGRTLSVANDPAGAGATPPPSKRKPTEPRPPEPQPAAQFHADSGVRFDSFGRPIEASTGDALPLADVPPEYTPS
ncbi:hypothetical protein BD413DRAFT_489828 [Trametes elegans]|nr:hypothetical protein BD413DRAFT_489828 [Trametes elegans]